MMVFLYALTCLYWRILCPNTRFTLLLFSTLKLSKTQQIDTVQRGIQLEKEVLKKLILVDLEPNLGMKQLFLKESLPRSDA